MADYNILLVEDDLNLGFVIQDNLQMKGYKVTLATDGKSGLKQFNKKAYDLCVLDVMLPQKDGFTLAKDIRKINEDIPIFFLTAKSMTEDKIEGFKAGGDDYLTKPFSTEEFLMRVKALLKRSGKRSGVEKTAFKIGNYLFNYDSYVLSTAHSKNKLTKKEADILKLLCTTPNKVVERSTILNAVWGDDSYYLGRSLDVFISKLRKYLSEDEHIKITNVHGVGFKLEY